MHRSINQPLENLFIHPSMISFGFIFSLYPFIHYLRVWLGLLCIVQNCWSEWLVFYSEIIYFVFFTLWYDDIRVGKYGIRESLIASYSVHNAYELTRMLWLTVLHSMISLVSISWNLPGFCIKSKELVFVSWWLSTHHSSLIYYQI